MGFYRGCVQVYTGDGKGKTTAAVGMCLRALAAGKRVFFGQFMKHGYTGERQALASFGGDAIQFVQFGRGSELRAPDPDADAQAACEGLAYARRAMETGDYDVVVLDEANVADSLGYFPEGALAEVVEARPHGVELVITGRGASAQIIELADLVSDVREVKHYYAAGVPARRGVEF